MLPKKNYRELEALVTSLESPTEILCLTETWLSDSEEYENYRVCGYKEYSEKNRVYTGGGVMIQLRDAVIFNDSRCSYISAIKSSEIKNECFYIVRFIHYVRLS